MILQALTQYYETLVQAGVLAGPGWGPVKASYALSIAADGTLEQVTSIQTEQLRGKRLCSPPGAHAPCSGQTHSRDRRQFSVR